MDFVSIERMVDNGTDKSETCTDRKSVVKEYTMRAVYIFAEPKKEASAGWQQQQVHCCMDTYTARVQFNQNRNELSLAQSFNASGERNEIE